MSKGNDSSKLGRAPQVRELRDDELENVSGGVYQYMGGDEAIVSPRTLTRGCVSPRAPLIPPRTLSILMLRRWR